MSSRPYSELETLISRYENLHDEACRQIVYHLWKEMISSSFCSFSFRHDGSFSSCRIPVHETLKKGLSLFHGVQLVEKMNVILQEILRPYRQDREAFFKKFPSLTYIEKMDQFNNLEISDVSRGYSAPNGTECQVTFILRR